VAAPAAPALVSPTPRPGVRPVAPIVRLGEWDLRSVNGDDDHALVSVAASIDTSFDVVVVTNVAPDGDGRSGLDALQRALGQRWAVRSAALPRGDDGAGGARPYAVLYRRDRIAPCGSDTATAASDGGAPAPTNGANACFEAGPATADGLPITMRLPVREDDDH
jgi:hypothetical protein